MQAGPRGRRFPGHLDRLDRRHGHLPDRRSGETSSVRRTPARSRPACGCPSIDQIGTGRLEGYVSRVSARAVAARGYGGVDALDFRDVDRPRIGPDEVLIRVRAAGVDRGTWHLMTGLPYLVRLAYGLRGPRNPVPGLDVAGVVEDIGDQVTRFAPGDEVFGIAAGSFAEYARARADKLAAKPAEVGFAEAATVAVSGLAALQAVRDHGRVEQGQRVLVIGASGGVGSFAVQVAKVRGAHVTGMCSTAKTDLVRALGAEEVVDYTVEDVTADGRRWDVVLDIGGRREGVHLFGEPPGPARAVGPHGLRPALPRAEHHVRAR